jgi:hypothetical protein
VKKCASCTKDLPDAALHCVFCGAKQPPAPAVQTGLARTAFGYSANEVLDNVRGRPQPPSGPAYNPPAPFQPPSTAAYGVPQRPVPLPVAPTMPAPRPAPYVPPPPLPPPVSQPLGQPYGQGPQGGFLPSSANAKTMFVQSGPGPMPQAPMPPAPSPYAPSPYAPPSPAANAPTLIPPAPQMLTIPAPPPQARPQPMAIPAAQPPPYLSTQTASRLIRPIEPWRDGLRAWMFLWGLALLAAFATPLSTSPELVFHWKVILDGEGVARLPPLLLAAIGLLSVVLAFLPMPTLPRGLIATLLGVAGIAVPIALVGVPPWLTIVAMVGMLLLVPSLLARNEYRDATTARLLVTLGAIGVLLPLGLPQNDAIPLVSVIKALIDLPGSQKVGPALQLGLVVIVVMSLLAWLPAPVTGAAKLWAWLLILWALIVHIADVVLAGGFSTVVTAAPNATLASWVAGAPGAMGSAYLALVGYGLASVIGKQLE